MKNKELARMFFEIADVLEIMEVQWKPNAYRKAARSLDTMNKDVESIYKKEGIKGLKTIPGVGQGIAEKIEEFLKTGKIKEYTQVLKKIPKGFHELVSIPGLGPKKAWKLYKEKGIKSRAMLEKAAKSGKIKGLRGFGERSQEDILKGISLKKKSAKKVLLGTAIPIARNLLASLKSVKGVQAIEIAGSIRRMKETVGDIDILAVAKNKSAISTFTSLKNVKRVLAKGPTKASVLLEDGIQADLRVLAKESFGAGLQYFTGSKDHNVALRRIAMKKGYKLSEYGLFKNKKYICGKTEKEIYSKLGLPFIPPELRENLGELSKPIPKIIGYNSIKGDLQMHSKYSDGNNTILEMARACEKMGYKYMALTDHSKSQKIAHGMDLPTLKKYLKEIAKVQKQAKIKILKGAEVDILKDGSLDYPDKVLKELDIVLAAVHSGFKQSESAMTKRICNALENPHVNIFAHPTGRIIGVRSGYAINMGKICEAAKRNKVALEIDSFPSRLDLNAANTRFALSKGCKIAIDTDSHSVDHLSYMELGIGQARRAGAEPKDVINTWSLQKLEKFLRKR